VVTGYTQEKKIRKQISEETWAHLIHLKPLKNTNRKYNILKGTKGLE